MCLPDGVSKLWAKSSPRHPLWKHMLDTSAVSLALRPPAIDSGWSAEQTALLVGLHDIGKANPCFQHQQWTDSDGNVCSFSDELGESGFPNTGDAPCRHERISAQFIKAKLEQDKLNEFTADAISRAVVAHHGYWCESPVAVAGNYAAAQDQLCEMLQQALEVSTLPRNAPSDLSAFGMRLAGHVVLSDWIASNEQFFTDSRLCDIHDPKEYFAKAKELAAEWIHQLELDRDCESGSPNRIVKDARSIQKALLDNDIPPGLVIIEAPMGEGKTEAAWILAEKWRDKGYHGVYMALPTMATSDSLHRRYQHDYLGKLGRTKTARLVHGMAWLRDDKEPNKPLEVGEPGDDRSLATAWFRPTRRAMLAAHGVGTVDQAMLAGMNVKFGFLRLYGLADRVLVLDEVHAYDAYMSAIICRLLNWCACLKIPVVMLSATLSAKQREAMLEAYGATGGDPGPDAPYPLITVAEVGKEAWTIKADASSSRTLKIETHTGLLGNDRKTAAKAAELVKDGGCCCVILNTVKQAQSVYEKLPAHVPKLLFHSRFTAADRESITNEVLGKFGKGCFEGEGEHRERPAERPDKFVLVATQVVEQSLDVDFDHMISEIAPIDLLLQRSGRIKRHARTKEGVLKNTGDDERGEPVLHVLLPTADEEKPKFGASENIYKRYPLLRTLAVLSDSANKEIELPARFRRLINTVYGDDLPAEACDDVKKAKQEWDDLQEELAAQAAEFLLCEPMPNEFDPVGADEVGDDSDDGNGWRARTRLGLEDVMVIPLKPEQVAKWKEGKLRPRLVKRLYKRSVKIRRRYWPPKPAKGYGEPILGERSLRGVWLLPVEKQANGWSWSGVMENGKSYAISYDETYGLRDGGEK